MISRRYPSTVDNFISLIVQLHLQKFCLVLLPWKFCCAVVRLHLHKCWLVVLRRQRKSIWQGKCTAIRHSIWQGSGISQNRDMKQSKGIWQAGAVQMRRFGIRSATWQRLGFGSFGCIRRQGRVASQSIGFDASDNIRFRHSGHIRAHGGTRFDRSGR